MNAKFICIGGAIAATAIVFVFAVTSKSAKEVLIKGVSPIIEIASNKTNSKSFQREDAEAAINQETSLDPDMAELEKISDELMAFKTKVGDDPEKMTTKELEDQVTLMDAYNKQLHKVLKNAESSL